MKAVRVAAFGGPEVLSIVDVDQPAPGPGEVLLQVKACALNWSDLLQRAGNYPGGPVPPFVAGQEAAGLVVAVGAGVSSPAVGSRVAAVAAAGMQAQYAVVPARHCFPLPVGLPFAEGAAALVSLLSAGAALTVVGRGEPGETVLVHAAAGGLGTMAVQVAAGLGLTVVGTASSPEKRARVAALGEVVTCGYDEFPQVVREITGGRGVDVIVDGVGGEVFKRGMGVLRPLGRVVLVGCSSGEPPRVDTVKLIHRSQAVLGFHLGALLRDPHRAQQIAARFLPWLAPRAGFASGEQPPLHRQVRAQVGHLLPLEEVRAAHMLLASRESYGKIVLIP